MRNFIGDFLGKELDNFLHKNPETAEALKKRIEQNERERKDMAGIKKLFELKKAWGFIKRCQEYFFITHYFLSSWTDSLSTGPSSFVGR